ncbi:hypothetical protein G3A_12240 [Bacillus sp. 17376]|uniref:Uncharacterized protein n=1 Tax=Mesobacillus boroniphilus JCM 21738 TaxID=1294265 RepID=W4RJ06_9BACI|nr:hypothetical protein [Mesobacillus boroniphilus]ESU32226.1 hypothetical protein G3A_12240 [Bacillus sp. 17376]GAE43868.1 hypothetical protein JCM21738_535 [Mesobacillus boroniphilus JCM 21738]
MWLKPVIYSVLAFLLALAVIYIDLDAFLLIGRTADDSLKKSIWELYIYSMEKFDSNELKDIDQIYLNEKKRELSTVLGIAL